MNSMHRFPFSLRQALPVFLTLPLLAIVLSCKQDMNSKNPSLNTHETIQVSDLPIDQFVLPNGLKVVVQEDHSSPVVSVQAWCNAGSITENERLGSGLSHILEHMLFKGTERRGNSEIAQTIQGQGGYVNAYTSFDRTVYYIDAPSAGWKTILDVLADAMFHSTLPVEEYSKEQEVIRREFAMGEDDPARVMYKSLFATAFQVHPYKYPVIGYLDIYNTLTREDVVAYYKKHYVPNNLTFIVVGDVKASEVREFLENFTKDIPRKVLPDPYIPQEPAQLGKRERHEAFPTEVPRMMMAWHIPGITDPDLYALDVLSIIAGDGASSRLHQELVEKQKILRSVSSFSYTPAQSGLWGVSAVLLPGSETGIPESESAIQQIIEKFKTGKVSAQELEKARRKVLAERASGLKTVSGKASSIGSSLFVAGDVHFDETYMQGVSSVTAEEVQRVARTYLTKSNLSVISISKDGVVANKETTAEKSGSGLEQKQTESGLPVVLLADNKVPLVTVRAILRGGALAETPDNSGISTLMTRLLQKGTAKRSAEQIALEIENLGGAIDSNSGNNSISVSVEVLSSDVNKAVELLSDVLLNPSFPEDEVQKEKQRQLADLQLQQDQPMSVAMIALRKNLFGDHPYGMNSLGTAESVSRITRDDIVAFHRKLLGSREIVLTSGGSFHTDTVMDLFNAFFAAEHLPAKEEPTASSKPTFLGKGQTIELGTNKAQAIVQIGFPGASIEDPDRAALELLDEALSDLASRLFIRIREKQSLAYFVGTNQLLGLEPGMFMYYAGTAPGKGIKVRDEILDEIRIMVDKGLDADEIERARAKLLGQRLLQDQSASAQAYKAGLNVLYGLGMDYEDTLNEKIRSLDRAEINAVIKRRFSDKNYICILIEPGSGK